MSDWGQWDDVDWVRETLVDATVCGVALDEVKVEVLANTWYVVPLAACAIRFVPVRPSSTAPNLNL